MEDMNDEWVKEHAAQLGKEQNLFDRIQGVFKR